MATRSLQFVHFTFPPSKPLFCNNNSLWSSKPSGSISLPNASDNQRIHRPTATFSRSEAGKNTTARAADTHLPSLEKQSLAGLHPKISAEASNARSTLQSLERPALHWQVNQTQSGSGEPQDGNRDQPAILENSHNPLEAGAGNEAGDASDDCDTGHIERAASQHNTFTTSEHASEPHGVPSTPAQAQAQPQTLPQSSTPLQDQNNQQGVNTITERASVKSALHFIPKASDSGDDGWTDEDTAELEKELDLALGEQVKSSAGTFTTPSPHSVEALQDEIQRREREITESISEELRDVSRCGSPIQDPKWWEQQGTQVVEGGAVVMQQKEKLAQPSVGGVQDLVEDANDHEDKVATEALAAAQPKIDEQCFRLRGVRTRQLPGRQTKTTQYRLVWGQRPNRLDSWLNEDDVQISMPSVSNSQGLALPIRVRKMHFSQCGGRKFFEYLVDDSTWITEDQLRILPSPMLALELKGSSPHLLNEAQCDVLLRHSTTLIRDEHGSTPRTSRSSSAQTDSALGQGIEPTTRKRGRRDMYTEISSDINDDDPRPTKQRKSRSAPAVTPPIHLRQSPRPLTTGAEIDELHSRNDDECSLISVGEQHFISQISRSSSAATEAGSAAYQEWPLHGLLKRTRTRMVTSFNLEFHLVDVEEDLDLSSPFQALGSHLGKATSRPSKKRAPSQEALVSDWNISTQRRGDKLTKSQESLLAKMIQDNMTWAEIRQHFPHHPLQLLKDNFFKKTKGTASETGSKAWCEGWWRVSPSSSRLFMHGSNARRFPARVCLKSNSSL